MTEPAAPSSVPYTQEVPAASDHRWPDVGRGEPSSRADTVTEHLVRARRWLDDLPADAVLSHWTAALAHGLPTYSVPAEIIATRTRGRPVISDDARLLKAQLRPGLDTTVATGTRLTTVARTVVDLARRWSFEEALPTADASLRTSGVCRAHLEEMLRFQWTWPRIRRAMPVVQWASPLSESVLESYIRGRIIRLRLPVPEQQVNLGGGGEHIGRVDFYWRSARLVGEADGRLKYGSNPLAVWAEKLRQESLEEGGFTVIRWNWASAHAPDDVFAARLQAALDRAAIVAGVRDAIDRTGPAALVGQSGIPLRTAADILTASRLNDRTRPSAALADQAKPIRHR